MPRRQARRIERPLTPAEQDRLRRARKEAEQDKPRILASARQAKAHHDAALAQVRETIRAFRAEREAQGLSLADVRERTGFGRSALCRLETELEPNPTISTLLRYADALGKRLVIRLED